MTGIRVPAHLQDKALEIGAEKWAKAKGFPRNEWYEAISEFTKVLSKLTGSSPPQNELIVAMIAIALDAENSLVRHVLKSGIKIDDPNEWANMCSAAAWVVLLEYLRDVGK